MIIVGIRVTPKVTLPWAVSGKWFTKSILRVHQTTPGILFDSRRLHWSFPSYVWKRSPSSRPRLRGVPQESPGRTVQ